MQHKEHRVLYKDNQEGHKKSSQISKACTVKGKTTKRRKVGKRRNGKLVTGISLLDEKSNWGIMPLPLSWR